MAKWLSLKIAEKTGVCANFSFLFPNRFIDQIINLHKRRSLIFTPEILTFRIMSLLTKLIDEPQFKEIKFYLYNQGKTTFTLPEQKITLYRLSKKIADTFDQYLLYRPHIIFDWEKRKKHNNWQAILWRHLTANNKEHRAYIGKKFIQNPIYNPQTMPDRVSIFGITTLPPIYFEIISILSAFCQINLFILNPSYQYWGDILSDKQIGKTQKKYIKKGIVIEDRYIHIQRQNNLLASMGTSGKQFIELIIECQKTNEIDSFQKPQANDMIGAIQEDIFNLTQKENNAPKKIVSKKDKSIAVHSCHSHIREIQTLHDNLLDMFEKDPCLKPSDIMVMAPNIEAYSTYIDAVFGSPEEKSKKIPYSIADRPIASSSRLIQTLFLILDAYKSRYKPSAVFAILAATPIKNRFKITDSQIEQIYSLIKKAEIKWGINGKHKANYFGAPESNQNTWEAGFDRFILGYATGNTDKIFSQIIPYPIEADTASAVGRFFNFFYRLASLPDKLSQNYRLDKWAQIIKEIISDFFQITERNEKEARAIFNAAAVLIQIEKEAQYKNKIGIETIKAYLTEKLAKKKANYGFLTGKITFCEALPMRGIPFKIICFIGLNENDFPRQDSQAGFNIIASNPRACDKSKRNEDKHLFLEALLCVRKKLYISYIGQDIRSAKTLPPSILVSELINYIENGFAMSDNSDIKNHIITKHKLQSFSGDYFNPNNTEKLFTYSTTRFNTAKFFLQKKTKDFAALKLPDITINNNAVPIDELKFFFSNPSKYFANKCLTVFLPNSFDTIDKSENFGIAGLDKYKLENIIIEKKITLKNDELNNFIKASGILPYGSIGDAIYTEILLKTDKFFKIIKKITKEKSPTSLNIKIKIKKITLTARVTSIYGEDIIKYRYGKIRPIDKLKAWIDHLILKAAKPNETYNVKLIGQNPTGKNQITMYAFNRNLLQKDAEKIISNLMLLFLQGNKNPLNFFPNASYAYAKKSLQDKEKALLFAKKEWQSTEFAKKESDNPYYKLLFKNKSPLDDKFQEYALEIFTPLIKSITTNNNL